MLFREIISAYSEKQKFTNLFCGTNWEFMNIKVLLFIIIICGVGLSP
jgi:hypothetical protein